MRIQTMTLTGVALLVIAGCTTPQQRKAAERAQIKKEVAQEVARICSLPTAERDAELKKLKKESGMELYCAGGKP